MANIIQSFLCRNIFIKSKLQLQCLSFTTLHRPSGLTFRSVFRCPRENCEPSTTVRQSHIQKWLLLDVLSRRCYATAGFISSFFGKISLKAQMKYPKYVLRRSSLRLYLCCVELIDHDLFLKEFNMPDTFNSWFRITELHVWMCMVRLAQEGREGIFIRNNMMHFLWQDIEKKTRKLGENAGSYSSRREGIQSLSEQFKAILYAYDEGLLSDDKVLAGALWRNFFEKTCQDVEHLEKLVEYVRKQLYNISQIESSVMLTSGLMTFQPLYETGEALERNQQVLAQIMKRL